MISSSLEKHPLVVLSSMMARGFKAAATLALSAVAHFHIPHAVNSSNRGSVRGKGYQRPGGSLTEFGVEFIGHLTLSDALHKVEIVTCFFLP